jgi:tetratricopeptide (TPR) repeat protein
MLQARRLIPASTGVLGELGWTYLEQQKEIEARQTFGLLKDDLDVTARTLGMTGLLWCDILSATSSEIERKDFREQLESSAKELAKTAVPISEAHFAAAIAYRLLANEDTDGDKRRGHLLAALKQARRATDIDEIAVCHRLLGRILYDLGSVASAKEHLERSIELQPYRGDYAGLGLIHLSQGEHAKALGTIEAGLHRLADGWTADSGFPPTTPQQVDIYAALGATHLDLDLRMGKPADHTMLALRYLRQAVEAEQRHPFAVDNLATALTFTGSSREAVQILRRAIKRITHPPQPGATRHSPARHLERWSDKRDLTALRERLVEVHRTIGARDGMSPMRAREVKQLLREIQAITPDRYKAIQGKLSQDLTDFARVRRNRRWSERAVAALTATGLVWLFDLVNDWHVSTIESIGVGAGLLILFLLVLRLATGIRVKITGLEVDLHLSPSIEMLDLPTRISAHLGFGRFDAARTQWTSIWTSDSRLPQLGPAVGPLIKEYYSHRDQVLPWRRR